jgi:hypothetical protein
MNQKPPGEGLAVERTGLDQLVDARAGHSEVPSCLGGGEPFVQRLGHGPTVPLSLTVQ